MIAFLVGLAGSIGAISRFVIDGHIRTKYVRTFPWATFVINITGSFVLGLISTLVARKNGSSELGLIIGVGFCGGYTTFSTASFETVRLLERREHKRAFTIFLAV